MTSRDWEHPLNRVKRGRDRGWSIKRSFDETGNSSRFSMGEKSMPLQERQIGLCETARKLRGRDTGRATATRTGTRRALSRFLEGTDRAERPGAALSQDHQWADLAGRGRFSPVRLGLSMGRGGAARRASRQGRLNALPKMHTKDRSPFKKQLHSAAKRCDILKSRNLHLLEVFQIHNPTPDSPNQLNCLYCLDYRRLSLDC
jgi:hypothetical protein